MKKIGKLQAIMWTWALPGFSQLLTGQYYKATLFIIGEIIINFYSNFNDAIRYSYLGEFSTAEKVINHQWLIYYAFLFFAAMWDAYKHEMPTDEKLSFLPFVFAAFFVTLGLIYSTKVQFFGLSIGPVFLPMSFVIPGVLIGLVIRYLLLKLTSNRKSFSS